LEVVLLRLSVEKERWPRSSLRLDRVGEVPGDCCGVEAAVVSESSEPSEVARLCMLRL